MQHAIDRINRKIEPIRQQIIHHPVYQAINSIERLRIFMQFHVYAVWDFMSLLKSLQRNLTCVETPWYPSGNADTRYLINEIVCGEESDIDQNGVRKSHFELYREAMKQSGANTAEFDEFIRSLRHNEDFEQAFKSAGTQYEARAFVDYTFEVINSRETHVQAAVFTFGREDLIPNMFLSIVNDINKTFPDSVSIFKYYLDRHIEVDGDHHSHLALQMTEQLCGDSEELWLEAEDAVITALQKRLELWNGVHRVIQELHRGN
jgi:hypothetical protein